MKRILPVLAVVTAATGAPAVLAGQAKVTLTKPTVQYAEPFTQISGVRELSKNKAIITDMREKNVLLIDFTGGEAVKIGREGEGPGEYQFPAGILPLPAGRSLIVDMFGRFVEVSADGKAGNVIRPPTAGGSGPGGAPRMMGFGPGGSHVDMKGNLYFQGSAVTFTDDGPVGADSAPIMRWDRVKTSMDTIGWLGTRMNVSGGRPGGGGGRGFTMRIGGKIFEGQEAWGVAGDGTIMRVMHEPYRVLSYNGGKASAGPVIPWTPIKVTEADKKAFLDQMTRGGSAMTMAVTRGGGGGGTTVRQGPPPAEALAGMEFAETKPPFGGGMGPMGGGSVLVAPDGQVWVRKNQEAGAKKPLYDVFDRTGKLLRQVTLEPRSRVLGFGEGTVYVVWSDEDDLQYLQQFARP